MTTLNALAGGSLIGLAAGLYVLLTGRIMGISGMLGQVLNPDLVGRTPALPFFGGMLMWTFAFGAPQVIEAPTAQVVLGGILVGFGTRMGSGCTSGHGVCGLSRLSMRSLAAVATFMACGVATAVLAGQLRRA